MISPWYLGDEENIFDSGFLERQEVVEKAMDEQQHQ